MAGKNTAVFGIYPNRSGVERAAVNLPKEGVRSTDISVLFPENQGTKDFAHEKNTKAPEGAATGATSGAVIGGTLGWLVGIGALAIPGLGPFIAAGPIMAALAGAGAGGVVGGLAGAPIGLGISRYETQRYRGANQRGRNSPLSSLRQFRLGKESQRTAGTNRSRGDLFRRRSGCRFPEDR